MKTRIKLKLLYPSWGSLWMGEGLVSVDDKQGVLGSEEGAWIANV